MDEAGGTVETIPEAAAQLPAAPVSLADVKVQDVVPPKQEVVVLEHNQPISEGLKILAKNGILSAPLVISPALEDIEATETPPDGPSLLGWIDVRDILKAFLQHLQEKGKIPTGLLLLLSELETEGPVFVSKMLITIIGGEDRGLLYQTDSDAPLLPSIKEMFVHGKPDGKAVHRLAIFDAHGAINNIVSQLDVLRYLCAQPELLGPLGRQSLHALGLLAGKASVVTVDPHSPTLLAFDAMLRAGVSGAPVVAADGELVANLSLSDLRCIQPDHLSVLALPVAEFLALRHNTVYLGYSQRTSEQAEHPFFAATRGAAADAGTEKGHDGEAGVPLIAVAPEDSLLTALQTMCANHVHRVYVRAGGKVEGVVTPTDVLKLLVAHGDELVPAGERERESAEPQVNGGEAAGAAAAVAAVTSPV